MLREQVEALLDAVLNKKKSLFLIDLTVSPDHSIKVVIDGDEGVSLKDCIEVSRAIEHELDRDLIDFSLEVTSAGATTPLRMPRQYRKNVGRKLKVKTLDHTYEGNLTAVEDKTIILEWKAREPKPVGKGKTTVQKRQEIAISEIEEAKVVLKF